MCLRKKEKLLEASYLRVSDMSAEPGLCHIKIVVVTGAAAVSHVNCRHPANDTQI